MLFVKLLQKCLKLLDMCDFLSFVLIFFHFYYFIYSKFEEIYPPDVGEFVYITDDTYTKRQVLRMEHLILKVLHFDVAVPTSNQFMKRFLKAANADRQTEFLAQVCIGCLLFFRKSVTFFLQFITII